MSVEEAMSWKNKKSKTFRALISGHWRCPLQRWLPVVPMDGGRRESRGPLLSCGIFLLLLLMLHSAVLGGRRPNQASVVWKFSK